MGHKHLYDITKGKDAIWFVKIDEDGVEGEFKELNGWEAESDSFTITTRIRYH